MVEKLPYSAPDKAIPYCGMGSVFFNMEEYEMVVISKRLLILGAALFPDGAADPGSVAGGGHCGRGHLLQQHRLLLLLSRAQQGGHGLLPTQPSHLRGRVGHLPLQDCSRQAEHAQGHQAGKYTPSKAIKLQPEFKTLWKIYELDPFKKKKGTKKKKKWLLLLLII